MFNVNKKLVVWLGLFFFALVWILAAIISSMEKMRRTAQVEADMSILGMSALACSLGWMLCIFWYAWLDRKKKRAAKGAFPVGGVRQ